MATAQKPSSTRYRSPVQVHHLKDGLSRGRAKATRPQADPRGIGMLHKNVARDQDKCLAKVHRLVGDLAARGAITEARHIASELDAHAVASHEAAFGTDPELTIDEASLLLEAAESELEMAEKLLRHGHHDRWLVAATAFRIALGAMERAVRRARDL